MHSAHISIKLLKILVATYFIVLAVTKPTLGNPLTKRQFQKIVKLLSESMTKEIPSDADAQYSDVLYQEKYDKKNLTYYHAGDKQFPVFISNGLGGVGKPVHVLMRGEDYLNPKDRNNFVVLKKAGSQPGAYTVHHAHVIDMVGNLKKGGKVIWNDGRVEQQKNVKPLLQQMGNSEVQARSTHAQRPLCDWIGYSLLCNTPKNIHPARERKERKPLDEIDEEPVKLYGITPEEKTGEPGKKIKRYIGPDASKQYRKPASERVITYNDLGDGSVEDSERSLRNPRIKLVKPPPQTYAASPEAERMVTDQWTDGQIEWQMIPKRKLRRRHRRRRPMVINANNMNDIQF